MGGILPELYGNAEQNAERQCYFKWGCCTELKMVWLKQLKFESTVSVLYSPEAKTPKLGFRTMIGSEKV